MAKRKTSADTCNEIISELQKKIYKPIYFLTGDEPYYIDIVSDYIIDNVLGESEKAFNQSIIYGKDVVVQNIIETSRRFPMMSNHQVVVVKEAQQVKKLEDLSVYFDAPQKTTILVICHKLAPGAKLGERIKKLTAQAAKIGLVFESKRLYDNQVGGWIIEHLAKSGIAISPPSAELLNDYLGNDLSKIANELDKLVITLPSGSKKITTEQIEQNIGISKDYNRFELTKALGSRDVMRCNRIADYFAKNPSANPIVLTTISIYQYFNKVFKYHFLTDKSERGAAMKLGVNPFFVSDYVRAARLYPPRKCVQIFSLLREYDMRSKGVNNDSADAGDLLKELIFKIVH